MGLKSIPKDVLEYKALKKLRLDYNDKLYLDPLSGFPSQLSGLQFLSLRSCKLPYLPENIDNLKRLKNLVVEENLIEALPETFTRWFIKRRRTHSLTHSLNNHIHTQKNVH